MSEVENGIHVTKVIDHGLVKTKNGFLQGFIYFANGAKLFQVAGNEVGNQILAEAATLCGFKGKNLYDMAEKKALNYDLDVQIFVKNSLDGQGKNVCNVYVNDPNGGMKDRLNKKDATALMKELNLNLHAEFKDAKESIGEVKNAKKVEKKTEPKKEADIDPDDIPF